MVILCSDHAGLNLKASVIKHLEEKKIDYIDVGAKELDPLDSFVDYAKTASKLVVENPLNKGIFICGSGVGMCIVANKQKGIFAVNGYSEDIVIRARQHNNVNVLCLGEKFVSENSASRMVDALLFTDFFGGKYEDRLNNIE